MLQNKNKIQVITLAEWHAPGGSAAVVYWWYLRFRKITGLGRSHFIISSCVAIVLGLGINSALAYQLVYKHYAEPSNSQNQGQSQAATKVSQQLAEGKSEGKSSGGSLPANTSGANGSKTPTNSTTSSSSTGSKSSSGGSGSAGGGSSGRSCVITALLVNPCRAWLGGDANNYPTPLINNTVTPNTTVCASTASWIDEMNCFESRVGRQVDIWHTYNSNPGTYQLSSIEITVAKRANTFLYLNWKPTSTWADATGCGSSACNTVDSQIDTMANSIKSIGPKKMFLTIFHEPEDDVSTGGDVNCGSLTYTGSAGTVTDYVNMWHNVRARFNAAGVTNVVWVMNYMGYPGWNCLVKDLWPGNSYVDWVTWDPYATLTKSWSATVSAFYSYLTSNNSSTFGVLDKPWGLAEFGTHNMSQANVYNFYSQAVTAIHSNTFPKLNMYLVFDDPGPNGDNRLYFADSGAVDPLEQAAFNTWANDPAFIGSWTGP